MELDWDEDWPRKRRKERERSVIYILVRGDNSQEGTAD